LFFLFDYFFSPIMKKSQNIVLSAIFLAAISSCSSKHDEWSDGKDATGRTHDTSVYRNGGYHYYRYFGGGWFPLGRNNMINTGAYMPASGGEIGGSGFSPRASSGGIRSGGFGGSAGGESGGE
jgi:hypothetical protein